MFALLHSTITWLGAVGSGESSPLSVNSTFAELIRLVQVGIFAGVLWLLKEVKATRSGSDETHSTIISDIKAANSRIDNLADSVKALADSVSEITKGGPKA